jgi:hypothetical protein
MIDRDHFAARHPELGILCPDSKDRITEKRYAGLT